MTFGDKPGGGRGVAAFRLRTDRGRRGIRVVDTTESEGFSAAFGLSVVSILLVRKLLVYRFGMYDVKGHVRHTFTVAMQHCLRS
jgi:hypothetical protein